MTHAHSRHQNPAADPGVRLDPEDIRQLRRFADRALLPGVCPRDECRRTGQCRGALTMPEFYGEHPLPFCLTQAFDGLYEPVVRWLRILKDIKAVAARRAEAAERPKR